MNVRLHPTALIEDGVKLGDGTSVWDNVHIRKNAVVGDQCIIGEKSYIAYDVRIGHRVKINAMVYICAQVTIEDGVMISAGTIFTNDRFPRAATATRQGAARARPARAIAPSSRASSGARSAAPAGRPLLKTPLVPQPRGSSAGAAHDKLPRARRNRRASVARPARAGPNWRPLDRPAARPLPQALPAE